MILRRLSLVCALLTLACSGRDKVEAKEVFTEPKIATLAEAVAKGDRDRIRDLVQRGADPNARGDQGVTLLQWALLNQSRAGLEELLELGADPALPDSTGETVVHYAAKANEPAYLDVLLEHGADPNSPHAVTQATPLMSALLGNRDTQFRKLLDAGAKPDAADRLGNTALHVAAKINAYRRVLDLLEAGADPAARNQQGATFQRYLNTTPADVLSDGARARRTAVVDWLRAHGVPIEETRSQ